MKAASTALELREAEPGAASSIGGFTDAQRLRGLVKTILPISEQMIDAWRRELDVMDDYAEVSVELRLPQGQVTSLADTLRVCDLAWRVSGLISDIDEALLPPHGPVNLDQLMPPELEGLFVMEASEGSFKVKLTPKTKKKLKAVASFVVIVALPASGYTARDLGDVFHGHGTRHGGPPRHLTIAGDLKRPLSQVLQNEFGPYSLAHFDITVNVTTPDGLHLELTSTP